ncbi:MAG: hypothetical protein QXH26_01225 [Candidatus Hadarchaeales archaeon]
MEWVALKAGVVCLAYISCFTLLFHLFRRKLLNVAGNILLAGLLSIFAVLPFYRFSPSVYYAETQQVLDLFLSDLKGLALGILLCLPLLAAGFLLSREAWLGRWLWAARKVSPITYRCLGQLLGGSIFCYFAWFKAELAFFLACFCLCAMILGEYSRLRPLPTFRPILRGLADRWIGSAAVGEAETKLYAPSFFFLSGILFSLLLFPSLAFFCIAMGTFTDPISGLVDEFLGKTKIIYSPHKTMEGSLSFLLVGTVVLHLLRVDFPVSLLVSIAVMFLESLCVRGGDNFVVPLSTGLFLTYFGY